MKEDFIQYLWAESLILPSDLTLKDGTPCQAVATGTWNEFSGPDFKDAIVRIGDTTWVGQVEIHIKSSDWKIHNHHQDPAYDNVILHVVLEDNEPVIDRKGKLIPCLILDSENYLGYYRDYEKWLSSDDDLPCSKSLSKIPVHIWSGWLESLGEKRFVEKLNVGWSTLESTKGNIELTRWILLGRTMGAPLNEDGMEMLIRTIPWNSVRRRVWGFSDFSNWLLYMAGLNHKEFPEHLKNVFSEHPLNKRIWLHGKLRPPSFPSVRIMQWAWYFFKVVLHNEKTVPFWETAFWDGFSVGAKPGKQSLHTWRINMAPFQYVGDWSREQANTDRWKEVAPEKNAVIQKFRALNINPKSAFETQAILKLHKEYCRQKKCLNCAIGNHHLKQELHDRPD